MLSDVIIQVFVNTVMSMTTGLAVVNTFHSLPVEVSLRKGASRLYSGHIQRLNWAFEKHVRVDCSEAAEVMNPDQQGSGLTHGPHIQLPDDTQKQEAFSK